jgi:hypothetical protein
MSNIAVALVLTVLLMGATLFIGNDISTQAVDRGGDIGDALSGATVNSTTGAVTYTTP